MWAMAGAALLIGLTWLAVVLVPNLLTFAFQGTVSAVFAFVLLVGPVFFIVVVVAWARRWIKEWRS